MYLQQSIKKFTQLAPLLVPELLDGTSPTSESVQGEAIIFDYPIPKAMHMDRVIELLTTDMDLTLLYRAVSKDENFYYHACAFSKPDIDFMFKINVCSNTEGMVNGLTVAIYGSLEQMSYDLEEDLELHRQQYFLSNQIEKMHLNRLFSIYNE